MRYVIAEIFGIFGIHALSVNLLIDLVTSKTKMFNKERTRSPGDLFEEINAVF